MAVFRVPKCPGSLRPDFYECELLPVPNDDKISFIKAEQLPFEINSLTRICVDIRALRTVSPVFDTPRAGVRWTIPGVGRGSRDQVRSFQSVIAFIYDGGVNQFFN